MSKRKITIAVSGLNNIDSPGPGVPVIRGIRDSEKFEARIIGLAYENLEPAAYMPDMVDKTYKVPYPSEGTEEYLKRIEYIHSIEKIDVIVPNFDAELLAFIKSEKRLNNMGIGVIVPTLKQFEERQKSNLPEYGKKYNVKVPASHTVSSFKELNTVLEEFEFPVVVKGKFYDAYIARTAQEAQLYMGKVSAKWGFPVILQEFIRGIEVNVVAVGDGKGNTVGAVPMKKTYITDKGKAWGGITLKNDDMMQLTNSIISQTKWRGGMELELIRTANNDLYLVEINPRIPAWVYLAVGAGQNLPEAMVELALGEEVKLMTDYEVGKMFIRYSYDLITDVSEFEKLSVNGEL